MHFSLADQPKPSGGLRPVADFVFGSEHDLSGIFVYEQSGVLCGLEVYGMAGGAPKVLPTPDMLRPFSNASGTPNHAMEPSAS
jgi:hypothetical protein